jgi:magnesium-transporting ATPase (P-type)
VTRPRRPIAASTTPDTGLRAGPPHPGLTSAEAAERLARDGPNVVPEEPRRSVWRELVRQLTHLLALLLWVAVVLALLAGMPTLAFAIAVIVVVNAVFAFVQEYRADRSAQHLRRLLPRDCLVRRDGHPCTVDASAIVVGDLVMLRSGDRVPADLEVVVAHELQLDESLVTGESGGVAHRVGDALLAGSFVVQGEGLASVRRVGAMTTLAGIASLARSAERPPSPLSRQLKLVVRTVGILAASAGLLLGLAATLIGIEVRQAFLFGLGVAVALVPEGLLPTVTLSLARGARLMAGRRALVRRLDAVETLGATTFICTDKTGTLTQNQMSVVDVVTPHGVVTVHGEGYQPRATLRGPDEALQDLPALAAAAIACVSARVVEREGSWVAEGDPMEAAIHAFSVRAGAVEPPPSELSRRPFTQERLISSSLHDGTVSVLGAPEAVLDRCVGVDPSVHDELARLTAAGRRVLAIATRPWPSAVHDETAERQLTLAGLLGLEDPPRDDVHEALDACRRADIRVAVLTGDHPATAEAIAREVGLLERGGVVVTGDQLPALDDQLGALLDRPGGVVVARVTPADKFRIARVLRERGHVVAMTGDGVNDAPALREADVGVAMGLSGSDVTREAADLVLLDDHFGTIVAAVELGRATFRNVRRFLTYHLTDNVAELAPFALWALSAGNFPLAIGVLQVIALDIGTDMLPAIALGAEPANPRIMEGRPRRTVVDRALLGRALLVLGATEAVAAMTAFTVVLVGAGWSWGETPSPALLAVGSGTAFAAISLSQMANAFACRSSVHPVWRMRLLGNPMLVLAVLAELALLLVFLGVPGVRDQLGGHWPTAQGWALAGGAAIVLVGVDGISKLVAGRSRHASR